MLPGEKGAETGTKTVEAVHKNKKGGEKGLTKGNNGCYIIDTS